MQSVTRQVRLDSFKTYFQLLFPAPSLVWNLTRNRLEFVKKSVIRVLNSSSDSKCGWLTYFLWERAVNYRLDPWGSNRSSSNITDWPFSRLSRFSFNGISLRSGEAEMKKLQRSGQAHFLGASSRDSFPPVRSALRRSCAWFEGKPARRLISGSLR